MSEKNIFNSAFVSKEILVGDVALGFQNPIRIQSMTSTNTNDIDATLKQCFKLIESGCELVRIATPSLKEVKALQIIQHKLHKKGIKNPLIADVHYNPKVAEEAARFVEKVRINPGNYVDRNLKDKVFFTDVEYKLELEKIADKLFSLLNICKQNGTVIRIGTNHGSLSQRIIAKYGDTPLGMVESVLEFVKICENFQFNNIVLSMKSSNPKVMVQAYRLLVNKMLIEGINYPLHLGVTEVGNGIEGRIKSAVGIGTLLEEGIGDTIRVSLTEDPLHEIPVNQAIVKNYNPKRKIINKENPFFSNINPYEYNRRKTLKFQNIGEMNAPVIIGNKKMSADYSPEEVEKFIPKIKIWSSNHKEDVIKIKNKFNTAITLADNTPIIIKRSYFKISKDDFIIRAAIDFGSLQLDGLGDGIFIETDVNYDDLVKLSKQILQACGTRISSTEYIACPSCGRTQFDIQKALLKVKKATHHLVGLKLAVMGCIVNGPGEMADAHYGYVGSGNGKVNLYKSRKLVKKNLPENKAIEELIFLIKKNGDWTESL